jgi:hypothetical protein
VITSGTVRVITKRGVTMVMTSRGKAARALWTRIYSSMGLVPLGARTRSRTSSESVIRTFEMNYNRKK